MSVSLTKRFLEWWTASPEFRQLVETDPNAVRARYGLDLNPEDIRLIWDRDWAQQHEDGDAPIPDAVREYRKFIAEKSDYRDTIVAECQPRDPRFHSWQERQKLRSAMQLYRSATIKPVHIPICFELTSGCSVGCWFCSLEAQPLTAVFPYTVENARLWQEVLAAVFALCGPAAKWGFCYWGTEPFDNPDYEKFCRDFHTQFGIFPQTTTAIPLQNPERTRALLLESHSKGCRINRFSAITLKQLAGVMETFSAEELLSTEIISQNPESDVIKIDAGRFREARKKTDRVWERERNKYREFHNLDESDDFLDDLMGARSSACVSGFLINMIERSIKLVSPCPPSEIWPHGHIVFAERSFTTADEFAQGLEELIVAYMPTTIQPEDRLRFRSDLEYREIDSGFQLATKFRDVKFLNPKATEFMQWLGAQVQTGSRTAGEIAMLASFQHRIPEANTLSLLSSLLTNAVLDELFLIPRSGLDEPPAK